MIDEMDPRGLRRREERYRVIKGAKIIFGETVIDCLVLNISRSGACIKTLSEVAVPEYVILSFPNGGSFRAQRRAFNQQSEKADQYLAGRGFFQRSGAGGGG